MHESTKRLIAGLPLTHLREIAAVYRKSRGEIVTPAPLVNTSAEILRCCQIGDQSAVHAAIADRQ